jgi:phage-related protein
MTSHKEELKHRIEAKRKELEAKLQSLQADAHGDAAEKKKQIQQRLSELDQTLRQGWDDLSEDVARRLNEWLDKQ